MQFLDEGDKWHFHDIIDMFESSVYEDTSGNFDKRFSVTERGGRPYSYSPREIGEQMVMYFRDCAENARPFSISMLCLHLGISREGMRKMEKSSNEELVGMIKKGKVMVEFYWEYVGQKMPNPAFAIFVLKNMGWHDKRVIEPKIKHGMTDEERIRAIERIKNFSE